MNIFLYRLQFLPIIRKQQSNIPLFFLTTSFEFCWCIMMAYAYIVYYGIYIRMLHAHVSKSVPLRFWVARAVGPPCTVLLKKFLLIIWYFQKTSYITISLFLSTTVLFNFKSYTTWIFFIYLQFILIDWVFHGISWHFL